MLNPKITFNNSGFAFHTIQERWPKILTQLIDSIYRNREKYCKNADDDTSNKLKELTRHVGQLRYEIMTNKPLTLLLSAPFSPSELQVWNQVLSSYGMGTEPCENAQCQTLLVCWYDLPFLFAECYLYRRIVDAVFQSGLNDFDPFFLKKQCGLKNSGPFISSLLLSLSRLHDLPSKQAFDFFLHSSLWANEYDLSLRPDGEFQQTGFDQISDYIKHTEEKTIVNDKDAIHKFSMNLMNHNRKLRVAIILDNAGPELIADLCLAEYFVASNSADSVSFYGKCMPWFVSDVTRRDFDWLLNVNPLELEEICNDQQIHSIIKWSEVWRKRVEERTFQFKTSSFWTMPYAYDEMQTADATLYEDLSKNYDLIIFKGDLNYRKIVGDRQWKPDSPEDKVNAFGRVQIGRPSSCKCSERLANLKPGSPIVDCSCGPMVVSLRIAKSDVAVGVNHDCLVELQNKNKDWWTVGQYGFIQVVSPIAHCTL
ncbi:unnamed protein product [Trichobilharzia szidati]|nr:unnamed protein product [Trichobilharzia szidati]